MKRFFLSILMGMLIANLAFGVDIKSQIGTNDFNLDTDGAAHGTFQRRTSTGGTITLDKIDGNQIPWSNTGTRTIRPKHVIGPGTGNISGYDNVTITGNLTGDNTGNISGFDNLTISGKATIGGNLTWATDNAYDIGASGATRPRDLYLSNKLIVSGASGPHSIGGVDSESNSLLNIGGAFSGSAGTPTDVRAININATINTRALYSSEGINNRPAFVLPATGAVASVEGYHLDLSNANWSAGGTVTNVYGFRVRGVPLHSAVQTATGIYIENDFGTNASVAHYNILSEGVDSRNRFNGRMEVYGPKGHVIGNGYGSQAYVGLIVDPTSDNTGTGAGTDFSALMRIGWNGSANPAPNQSGYGLIVSPTIVEAASGTHSNMIGAEFRAPTITAGAAGVDRTATVKITGAPSGVGTYGDFALWIASGKVRWDDPIALGGGAAPTFGTIGGSGPGTAGQARWLRVSVDGTDSFIPVWQ